MTLLANIPSGAGVIPSANLFPSSGTFTHNQTVAADIVDIQDGGVSVLKVYDGGILDLPKQSGCRVYGNSNQTIAHNTATKVQFNMESYDNQSEFDPTTNYRFTVTKAGYYLVTAVVYYSPTTADMKYLVLMYKNGADVGGYHVLAATTGGVSIPYTNIFYLAANDYLEVWTQQVSGGDQTLIAGTGYSWAYIHKLS